MLGKMIKYDIMFGAKKYGIMAALSAALIVVAVAAASLNSEMVLGISLFLAVVATVVYVVMYIVISVRHLSTQLCSNESYLGYSLPASAHTLVLSKLISILIWGVVTIALIIFFWVVGIGGIALAQSEITLKELWEGIISGFKQLGMNENGISSMLSMVTWICITASLMSVCLLGFSVAVCNIPFLKERGIGTVTGVVGYFVLYYGISYALSKIGNLFNINDISYDFMDSLSGFDTAIRSFGVFYSIAFLVVAVGFYFLTVYTVDKHRFIG